MLPVTSSGFKPAAENPRDRLELQQARPERASVEVSPVPASEQAAFSALPALASLPLAERMKQLPVEFMVRRRFRLWFMDRHKAVSADKAAGLLGANPRLRVRTSSEASPLPLANTRDFEELEALQGAGDTSRLDQPGLADQLKQLASQKGLTFTVNGFPVDAYGAYNYLTTGFPEQEEKPTPVLLRCHQLPVRALTSDPVELAGLQPAIDAVRAKLNDPMTCLDYLVEFHKSREQVSEDLGRLARGTEAPVYSALMRAYQATGNAQRVREGLKSVSEGTLAERLQLLEETGYYSNHYNHNSHLPGEVYDKLRQGGLEDDPARSICRQLASGDRYYESWTQGFQELAGLCPASPQQVELYGRLLAQAQPAYAAQAARVLASPAGNLDEKQRIQHFDKLKGSVGPRAQAWPLLQAELERGASLEEATKRCQRLIGVLEGRRSTDPASEYAARHPDRLEAVCSLLEAGAPPSAIAGLVDSAHSLAGPDYGVWLSALHPLGQNVDRHGPIFLEALQTRGGPSSKAMAEEIRPLVQSSARVDNDVAKALAADWAGSKANPERTQVLAKLVDLRLGAEAVSALHGLESWPGDSPLTSRLDAMVAVGAGAQEYSKLSGSKGGRTKASQAFKALLGAGVPLAEARKRLESITGCLYNRYDGEQATTAVNAVATHAANPGALDLFQNLLFAGCEARSAAECTDQLVEPAGSSTQSDRIGVATKLGLDNLRNQEARLGLIALVRAQLTADPSAEQARARLAGLVKVSTAPVALQYVAAHLGERERMQSLLEAGFPPEVAGSTLDRAQGAPLQPFLPLGKAGRSLTNEAVKAFQSIPQADPATLTRLATAYGKRPTEAGPLVTLFSQQLNGQSEKTDALSRLHEESRLQPQDVVRLYQALEPAAGRSSLSERVQAVVDTGGLVSGYQEAGSSIKLALLHAGALTGPLAGGVPMADAKAALQKAWSILKRGYNADQAGAVLERLGRIGGDTERRDFLLKRLESNEPSVALSAEALVEGQAGTSRYAERAAAFDQLDLGRYQTNLRDSIFQAYRAERDQGAGQDFTLQRLGGLQKALEKWNAGEQCAVFNYVAETHPAPNEVAALHDQLAAGVRPSVAVGSLQRAVEAGDLTRLKSLKGLGKAGSRLDDSVAAAFQLQQQEALDRKIPASTVAASLERVTGAVASQNSESSLKAAAYWGQKLVDQPEANEIFSRLLEHGQGVDNSIALLELMQQPAGNTTLTQRFEAHAELGGLKRDYYDPGNDLDRGRSYYGAVAAGLGNGVSMADMKKELGLIWSYDSYEKRSLKPLLAQYAAVAPAPAERTFLIGLLNERWSLRDAVRASSWLHQPVGGLDFNRRRRGFEQLGLTSQTGSAVLDQALTSLSAEIEQGASPASAGAELKDLMAGLRPEEACQAMAAYTGPLAGKEELRAPFRRLLKAGVPAAAALESVQQAPSGKLQETTSLVECLGAYQLKLTPETARSFRQAYEEHGHLDELKRLGSTLAAGKLEAGPALEYYTQNLIGREDSLQLFLSLLQEFPSAASQAHASLEKTGGDCQGRFELLKQAGTYKLAASHRIPWLADVHEQVIEAGRLAGHPADEVQSLIKTNFGYSGWSLESSRKLYSKLLEKPQDMLRWNAVFCDLPNYSEWAHDQLHNLPSEVLDLYPNLRQASLSPEDSVRVLAGIREELSATNLEDRRQAYEKMARVSGVDGRSLGRRAWGSLVNLSDVTTGEMPTLVTIYNKLVGLGQTSERACDLVCNIYATEQAKGVNPQELAKRLDQIAEVAKLDIRPDTGVAVLRDDKDRVVFSGVTVKKRKPPTA